MVIFDITKIYAMRQTCKLSSAFSIPVSRTYREQHSSQFTNDCLSLISQVNLLILEPRNEHLRETLFWTIFRNTIIFKDLDDAIDYGTKLAKRNQPPMAMYSEDGQKILGDGILDPHSSPPSKLDYVFGMQSPCNTTEFSSITSGKFQNASALYFCYLVIPQANIGKYHKTCYLPIYYTTLLYATLQYTTLVSTALHCITLLN